MRLLTFGGLALQHGDRPASGAGTQRRPLAVLAVLAAAGPRGVSRERLQALFWPERDAEHGRHVLAQTIYALRRDLGDPAVVAGTSELRLGAELVGSDVADFDTAAADGALERAALMYAGPFLDGVHLADAPEFERWADGERDRRHRRAVEVLEQLARAAEAGGAPEAAVGWWRRLAALDPLCGRVALHLMSALAATGDAAGAIRHARVHETLLREELGAAPDATVTAFVERLRTPAGSLPAVAPAPGAVPASVAVYPPPGRALAAAARATAAGTPPAPPPVAAAADDPPPPVPSPPAPSPSVPPAAPPPGAVAGSAAVPATAPAPTFTPDGPARPAPASPPWLLDVARRHGTAGAVLLAGATLAAIAAAGVAVRAPDPALVLIAPFDVADVDLRLWREGMVDAVARGLDGAEPVRPVSPTRVMREWEGRADREAVRRFARGVGAGTAVYGGLLRAGADSVRARVTVLDARSGSTIAEFDRHEAATRMDRLTDSVAADVLRAVRRAAPRRGAGG